MSKHGVKAGTCGQTKNIERQWVSSIPENVIKGKSLNSGCRVEDLTVDLSSGLSEHARFNKLALQALLESSLNFFRLENLRELHVQVSGIIEW